MIRFFDHSEIEERLRQLESIIRLDRLFPQIFFREGFGIEGAIDHGAFFSKENKELLDTLIEVHNGSPWSVFSLEPNPIAYYIGGFGLAPVVEGDNDLSARGFLEELWVPPPGGNSADSLACTPSALVAHDRTLQWCLYADRDFNILLLIRKKECVIDDPLGKTMLEPAAEILREWFEESVEAASLNSLLGECMT